MIANLVEVDGVLPGDDVLDSGSSLLFASHFDLFGPYESEISYNEWVLSDFISFAGLGKASLFQISLKTGLLHFIKILLQCGSRVVR